MIRPAVSASRATQPLSERLVARVLPRDLQPDACFRMLLAELYEAAQPKSFLEAVQKQVVRLLLQSLDIDDGVARRAVFSCAPKSAPTLIGWMAKLKTETGQLSASRFQRALELYRYAPPASKPNLATHLLYCMRRVPATELDSAERGIVFSELWPAALRAYSLPDWAIGILAAACRNHGTAEHFAQLLAATQDARRAQPQALGELANTAGDFKDESALRSLFSRIVGMVEQPHQADPFVSPLQNLWGTVLGAAARLDDSALFFEIFDYLEQHFDPCRYTHWGSLRISLRRLALALPPSEGARILAVLNHRMDRSARCFAELHKGPFLKGVYQSRTTLGGEFRFAGAGRELMQWMIGSYIHDGDAMLQQQAAHVSTGILALPTEFQRDAVFHLLARGHQSHAGAINALALEGLSQMASRYEGLPQQELQQLLAAPEKVKAELRQLIQPPQIHQPDFALPPGHAAAAQAIAALIQENQKDLFRGVLWDNPPTRWFDALSPLTEQLCDAGLEAAPLALSIQWIIQTHAVWVVNTAGRNRYLHDILNEFDRDWAARMRAAAAEPSAARELIGEFVGRIRDLLRVTLGIRTEPRQAILADKSLRSGALHTPLRQTLLPANYSVRVPPGIQLWLIPGQNKDGLIPMMQELSRNAEKALALLPKDKRLYMLEVAEEDALWYKLTVQNTFDASQADQYPSNGFGTSILYAICQRLRAMDNSERETTTGCNGSGWEGVEIFERVVYLPRPPATGATAAQENPEDADDDL